MIPTETLRTAAAQMRFDDPPSWLTGVADWLDYEATQLELLSISKQPFSRRARNALTVARRYLGGES